MGNIQQDLKANGKSRRGKPERQKPAKVAFGDYRFLRFELTAEEKEDFHVNYLPDNNALLVLCDLALPGYKTSQSWDEAGKTVTASITCNDPADENAGLIVSAKAGDISKAILVLGYKVLIVADDRPWAQVESERGGGDTTIG